MATTDKFDTRMKQYEGVEAQRRFMPLLPIVARIDGHKFSKFTRGMDKPFDYRMMRAMQGTTAHLVNQTHARVGYTQSDEITLVWMQKDYDSQIWFDGRIQKMCSVLAGMASSAFMYSLLGEEGLDPSYIAKLPHFDCRIWQLPSETEASNAFLWRVQDARKNSISMVAQAAFSHRELHQKDQAAMKQMLLEKGIDWDNDFGEAEKYGVFVQRKTFLEEMDDETWNRIPEAKRPESRLVTRSRVLPLELGYFGDVANRNEVLLHGEEPRWLEDTA